MSVPLSAAGLQIQQVKQSVIADQGHVQLGASYTAAVRKAEGIPPVTYEYGPAPSGGMATPLIAGMGPAAPGAAAASPDAQSGNWFWVSMNKWAETDGGFGGSCAGANGYTDPTNTLPHTAYYYSNMCCPGSSEAVISDWVDTPSTYSGYFYTGSIAQQGLHWAAYMFHLSQIEQLQNSCTPQYTTCEATEADTINNAIGAPFYTVTYNPSYSSFDNALYSDIATSSAPIVDEDYTCDRNGQNCFPNWPYRTEHWQAISQYNRTNAQVLYGETGNATDTCGSGHPGVGAPGVFTGSWTDPNTHVAFNDSSGWDYDGEQTQYNRTAAIVW